MPLLRPSPLRPATLLAVLFASVFSTLFSAAASAQNLYQIELVVFARDSADAEVEESWHRDYGLAYPKRLIDLAATPAESADPAQAAAPFQLLPTSARQLNDSARAIDRRANLRVLFHEAWVQPVGGIDSADPVLISGGRHYGQYRELGGYVVLTVERYLHLRTDLWMTRFGTGNVLDVDVPVLPLPVITVQTAAGESDSTTTAAAADASATPEPAGVGYIPDQIYVLDQERRMRSGEIHYIDHPRFGMLVLVTPYKAPEPPAPVESPAAAPTGETAPPISTAPPASTP